MSNDTENEYKEYFNATPGKILLRTSKAGNPKVVVPLNLDDEFDDEGKRRTVWYEHALLPDKWCVAKVCAAMNRMFDFKFTEGSPAEMQRAIDAQAAAIPVVAVVHHMGERLPKVYVNYRNDSTPF